MREAAPSCGCRVSHWWYANDLPLPLGSRVSCSPTEHPAIKTLAQNMRLTPFCIQPCYSLRRMETSCPLRSGLLCSFDPVLQFVPTPPLCCSEGAWLPGISCRTEGLLPGELRIAALLCSVRDGASRQGSGTRRFVRFHHPAGGFLTSYALALAAALRNADELALQRRCPARWANLARNTNPSCPVHAVACLVAVPTRPCMAHTPDKGPVLLVCACSATVCARSMQ